MIFNKTLTKVVLGITVCSALLVVACSPKPEEVKPVETPVLADAPAVETAPPDGELPAEGVIEIPQGEGELDPEQSLENEAAIMQEFEELMSTPTSPLEISAFADQYISLLSQDNAYKVAQGIVDLLNAKVAELEPQYTAEQKKIAEQLAGDLTEQKALTLTDEALLTLLVDETFQNGLMLAEKDGNITPQINPAFVEKYTAQLTEEQKSTLK